jgi:hypothetical protein
MSLDDHCAGSPPRNLTVTVRLGGNPDHDRDRLVDQNVC